MASKVKAHEGNRTKSNYTGLVYFLVGLSILSAYFAVSLAKEHMELLMQHYQAIFISEFIVLLAALFLSRVAFLNFFLFFTFSFITGLTLSPLIIALLSFPEGQMIVTQAFLMTLLITAALSIFAFTTSKNFLKASGFMFFVLLVFVGFGIVNYFLHSTFLETLYSFVGVIIFSIYLIIDTQRLIYEKDEAPTAAALMIYLDILNIFIFILRILTWFKSDKD